MNQISLSPFTNFNSAVPWGLWVGIYIWLVGISAGSFLLVMWGNFKDNSSLKPITHMGVTLALSTLLVGLLSIQIDLGHIERFFKLFTSPSPTSVMAWMVWLYGVYFVILVIALRWVNKGKGMPKTFSRLAFIFALAIIVVESLLFAWPPGKHWHSLIFVLHFLISALVSAIATLIFIVGILWDKDKKENLLKGLGKIALPIIVINLIVEIIDVISSGGISHLGNWVLFLGNIIAIIMLRKNTPKTITIAGFIGMIVMLLAKYNSLISAQLIESFKGFGRAYIEPRLEFSYMPTKFEWLVSIFLVCLSGVLFYILYKTLPEITEGISHGKK